MAKPLIFLQKHQENIMQIKNKRILLTGATGGIGRLVALMLATNGANLALVGRDAPKLQELVDEIHKNGGKAVNIVADFEQTGAPQTVIIEATKSLGGIDILINNAAILDFVQLEDQSFERIAQMIQTNVTAPIQLARAVLPSFKAANAGHFVMVGSIFGSLGFPHYATYCASKFAIHGFSQSLRRELVDTNIGVTYIAPRAVKTAMNDAATVAMMQSTGNTMDAPEKVAEIIINALKNEKQEVFIGQPQSFFAWLNGFLPAAVNMGLKNQTKLAKKYVTRKF